MTTSTRPAGGRPRGGHRARLGVHSEVGVLRTRARAPARPRARAAHPAQQGRSAVRRRALGQARPPGARRVRRRARRARRRGARGPAPARPRRSTQDDARAEVLDRTIVAAELGPRLGPALREWLDALPPTELAERLIGGVAYDELPFATDLAERARAGAATSCSPRCPTTCSRATPRPGSTAASASTTWPSRRACARRSTSTRSTATTRGSPAALRASGATARRGRPVARGRRRARDRQRRVLVGMGERTRPAGVEQLADRLFDAGAATLVIARRPARARARRCTSTPS